jgi:hypothetical protein
MKNWKEKLQKYYTLKNVTKEDFGGILNDLIRDTSGKFIQKHILKSPLFRYFLNYLKFDDDCLNVCTIVQEKRYTCQSYLDDYVVYYAKCYTEYDKYCKRIHFFSVKFDDNTFSEMIRTPTHSNWKKYLGCTVIKPLPKGIIGITYLDFYKNKKIERHYTCLCTKTINLFGHEYKIKTMPFKEQDGVVASCATVALWMAFQKTSEFFNTKAPSLSEVTILAGDTNSNSGKIFPSKGLELYQVCKAISNNGLISEIRTNFEDKKYFKNFVYAYIKGEIPVLLELKFTSRSEYHLVTVNGYRFDETGENKDKTKDEPEYVSDKIVRFYVHDDQIGPFAKIMFDENPIENDNGEVIYDYGLITPWWKQEVMKEWEDSVPSTPFSSHNKNDKELFEKAIPTAVVVPLHPTIKITFDNISEQQAIISCLMTNFVMFDRSIIWDIFIMKSNEYKKLLINEFKADKEVEIEAILMQSLPQYIWVIQARSENKLYFDYIYDTIELNKSGQPVAINIYENKIIKQLDRIKFEEENEIEQFKQKERELAQKEKELAQKKIAQKELEKMKKELELAQKKIEELNTRIKFVDACSNSFFIDKYEYSLIRILNEMPVNINVNTSQWEEVLKEIDKVMPKFVKRIPFSIELFNELQSN